MVVYALVNRSYALDLQPNKSWIRKLLAQGFDIYLLDWKPPTRMDKYVSFDDYVNSYIDDCVEIVQNNNSADKITSLDTVWDLCQPCILLAPEKLDLVTIAPVIDTSKIHYYFQTNGY